MTNQEKRDYIKLQLKLSRVIRSRGGLDITVDNVIKQVVKVSGIDIVRNSRAHDVLIPRQVAHYIAANLFKGKMSLGEIGYKIGHKDHATVIHSRRQVQRYIDTKDFILRPYLPLLSKFKLL
jgi:chromosomal replication initiator protein